MLVAAVCLAKGGSQVYSYVRFPEMLDNAPALITFATALTTGLELIAAYLAFGMQFFAFLALAAVVLIHLVFFPLGMVIDSNVILSSHYWRGFLISFLSNLVVALLAYASWKFSSSE